MTSVTTWDSYVEQQELFERKINLSMETTFLNDLSSYVTPQSDSPSIYELLKQILPGYDMETIAERYAARQKLAKLKIAAAERGAGMSTDIDSEEDQSKLALESETFATVQIESITLKDDFEE